MPQWPAWHERYTPAGLTVVGVHSPEFFWEKPYEKVVDATKRLDVRYPVVQDNDFTIWNRLGVRTWPTVVLVDRRGVVRDPHLCDGDYAESEAMIRRLLAAEG